MVNSRTRCTGIAAVRQERQAPVAFEQRTIAKYTAADVGQWSWRDDERGEFVGYIADQDEGASMGLAFVRFRKGVSFDFTWPYDEVSVVTKGSLSIRTGGRTVTAQEGEVLTQPRGVPGTFDITEDLEMIAVHHPTFAEAQGMTLAQYKAHTEAGQDAPTSTPVLRGPQHAGGFFDPTRMQSFALQDVPRWLTVDAEQGARVGYLADQAEGWSMGLAFSDFRQGGVYELAFAYDEVAAVTRGAFTVRSQGRTFTARAGEMLFMPKDVTATFEIDEDTVAVGMHYPTFQEVYGAPPHQA
jgi:ethanolamine utilization protein EutQ (cupin superfamily)